MWTERQRAMLEAMGLRVWPAPAAAPDEASPARRPVARDEAVVAGVAAEPGSAYEQGTEFAQAPAPAPGPAPAAAPARRPVMTGERPPGVESMDWPALREAVASCTACKLCESRRQTVFGVGHPRAHWMIVGEAPGGQEELQGEPFVGKAGQLLDHMLRAIGLTRAEAAPERQVYIANTLKCRPPGNRNPQPDELAKCEPFLLRQVALVRPRIILAMGRFAVQSLLRTDEAIGRLRGRVHRYQGVPLVVTYHPAYLLRNPLDKARSWEDLCLARRVLESASDPPP